MNSDNEKLSLQQRFSPNGMCFGCGPANKQGLRIESFVDGDQVVAEWQAQPHHEAFEGVLNGGIIGALLDCHSNWAGIWAMIQDQNLDHAPSSVTASLDVQYLRPTPTTHPIKLIANATELSSKRITVEAQLLADNEVCATSKALFIVVGPEHPAYHRWQ